MSRTIPTRQDLLEYTESVRLGGGLFVLRFKFNLRDGAWAFDILTEAGAAVRRGIKVVEGWPLLRTIATAGRPAGDIAAIDTTDKGIEPGQTTLGAEVPLIYFEAADL